MQTIRLGGAVADELKQFRCLVFVLGRGGEGRGGFGGFGGFGGVVSFSQQGALHFCSTLSNHI